MAAFDIDTIVKERLFQKTTLIIGIENFKEILRDLIKYKRL